MSTWTRDHAEATPWRRHRSRRAPRCLEPKDLTGSGLHDAPRRREQATGNRHQQPATTINHQQPANNQPTRHEAPEPSPATLQASHLGPSAPKTEARSAAQPAHAGRMRGEGAGRGEKDPKTAKPSKKLVVTWASGTVGTVSRVKKRG